MLDRVILLVRAITFNMNKKETKNTQDTFSLVNGVFWDLFHKDSPKRILKSEDLALVDTDYMKNMVSSMFDKEQLTLVDTKKLAVFDLSAMVLFFQDFGIFSAFFIVNLGVVSAYLLNSGMSVQNTQASAEVRMAKEPKAVYKARIVKHGKPTYIAFANTPAVAVVANAEGDKESVKAIPESKALSALIAYQQQERVLGASTSNVMAKDVSSCSFKQGTKLYSNNSIVTIEKSDLSNQVCIGLKNTSTTGFLWDVEGNNSKGNCVDLSSYNLSNGNIDVSVKIEDAENSSTCNLLVKKIN